MLSRLSSANGAQKIIKNVSQIQVVRATSSPPQNQNPQRDLINFPRPTRLEESPRTVFGFIPYTFFEQFYPKTGVTGPYMFLAGVSTYLISKEYFIFNAETPAVFSFALALFLIQKKLGPQIRAFLDKQTEKEAELLNSGQKEQKAYVSNYIDNLQKQKLYAEAVPYLADAKRENVYLQMEAVYRARLQESYTKVKRLLDYHVEKEAVERRFAQKNMADWVVRNVMSSITPQEKKNAIAQCLVNLKELAAKA